MMVGLKIYEMKNGACYSKAFNQVKQTCRSLRKSLELDETHDKQRVQRLLKQVIDQTDTREKH